MSLLLITGFGERENEGMRMRERERERERGERCCGLSEWCLSVHLDVDSQFYPIPRTRTDSTQLNVIPYHVNR